MPGPSLTGSGPLSPSAWHPDSAGPDSGRLGQAKGLPPNRVPGHECRCPKGSASRTQLCHPARQLGLQYQPFACNAQGGMCRMLTPFPRGRRPLAAGSQGHTGLSSRRPVPTGDHRPLFSWLALPPDSKPLNRPRTKWDQKWPSLCLGVPVEALCHPHVLLLPRPPPGACAGRGSVKAACCHGDVAKSDPTGCRCPPGAPHLSPVPLPH